jgi:hypothetical protein
MLTPQNLTRSLGYSTPCKQSLQLSSMDASPTVSRDDLAQLEAHVQALIVLHHT